MTRSDRDELLRDTLGAGAALDPAPSRRAGVSDVVDAVACPRCGTLAPAAERCRRCGRPPDDERVGRVLDGRYTLEAPIGEGGMGRVYRARHAGLDDVVAVKFVTIEPGPQSAASRARFRREAAVLARLRHPNIVSVLDYGEDHGEPYLVMELLRGSLLHALILAGGLTLPLDRVVTILDQVLQVLEAAHAAGVVHRDLKPENVMLIDAADRTDRVKVIDFGIALVDDRPERITGRHEMQGTPYFMSPEQCMGRDVGPPTDIYAVGVMLYELLVGAPPFDGSHAEIVSHQLFSPPPTFAERPPMRPVPEGVEALLMRALSKRAEQRPTAAEFRDALRLAARGDDPVTRAARDNDERARLAGLDRDERALRPAQPPPEAPAPDEDLRPPPVALWGFARERVVALRLALATRRVAAFPVDAAALPPASPDGRPWRAAVVPAGPDAAARTAALRAAALPALVVDLASPADATDLIRAGASDFALAAVDDVAVCEKVLRALRRGR